MYNEQKKILRSQLLKKLIKPTDKLSYKKLKNDRLIAVQNIIQSELKKYSEKKYVGGKLIFKKIGATTFENPITLFFEKDGERYSKLGIKSDVFNIAEFDDESQKQLKSLFSETGEFEFPIDYQSETNKKLNLEEFLDKYDQLYKKDLIQYKNDPNVEVTQASVVIKDADGGCFVHSEITILQDNQTAVKKTEPIRVSYFADLTEDAVRALKQHFNEDGLVICELTE